MSMHEDEDPFKSSWQDDDEGRDGAQSTRAAMSEGQDQQQQQQDTSTSTSTPQQREGANTSNDDATGMQRNASQHSQQSTAAGSQSGSRRPTRLALRDNLAWKDEIKVSRGDRGACRVDSRSQLCADVCAEADHCHYYRMHGIVRW